MLMTTVIEERLNHYARLELAGIETPPPKLRYVPVLLWTKDRDGEESWEILPDWLGELVIAEPHADTARARLYRRLPSEAPMWAVKTWIMLKMKGG